MPTPSELKIECLKTLRAAQKQLNSAGWILALEKQPEEVRHEAALQLLDVQARKLRLENEELSEIRDRLLENEADLTAGQAKVVAALKQLRQVAKVLESVRGFLGTLAKVLTR